LTCYMMTNTRALLISLLARAKSIAGELSRLSVNGETVETIKSVTGYVDRYEVDLTTLITDAINRDISPADMGRGMKDLIGEYAEDTYTEAYRDAGNDAPELDDKDWDNIEDWQAEQRGAVAGFVGAMKAALKLKGDEGIAATNAMLARSDLWVSALRTLAGKATARELADVMVTWKYGDTEHCRTCLSLNGKRKRLSWFVDNGYIPQENDSETLDCGGWRCQCELVNDKKDVILP